MPSRAIILPRLFPWGAPLGVNSYCLLVGGQSLLLVLLLGCLVLDGAALRGLVDLALRHKGVILLSDIISRQNRQNRQGNIIAL